VTAFDHIDDSRILLADTWGRLALLSVSRGQSGVNELRCVLLGEISCATTIAYLNNGIFYVGSYYGDCQLARLLPAPLRGPDGKLSHVQILDVYKNVAPISDAVITESEGSTQARIVVLHLSKYSANSNCLSPGHYVFRRVQ
jgi:DNA damage-binding protein 1